MFRHIVYRPLVLSLLTAAPVTAAYADDKNSEALEETVIVASRVPTPLSRVGVSVSVTDRETIEILGYSDVADFLDLQPGVSVTRDGGPGKSASVRIRGEEGFRTRVVLDGIDIADPSSPQISPRIEHLLSEGLQRIEVLRGPQGLAYGADAGGVIAMTTRQPETGVTASVTAEGGQNGYSELGGFVAGGAERFRGSLSITDLSTDGFNARPSDTQLQDDDGYSNTTIHGTASLSLTDALTLTGSVHDINGDNDYDGCFDTATFAQIGACTDTFDQSAARVTVKFKTALIDSSLSYEKSKIERAFYSAEISSFETEGEQEEISWIGSLSPQSGQRLTLGVDAAEQSLTDGGSERSRDNLGIWGEYDVDVLAGALTLGARWDDNDDFGQHTSWRISLQQQLAGTDHPLILRGAVGTGFRAPSLYEIAYNSGPFSYAPAATTALTEEKSQGWEIGLSWGQPNQRLEVTWFDQEIENEIYFDMASFSGYLQGTGTTTSQGLEIAGETAFLTHWRLLANITWNETKSSTEQQRPYRPEWAAASSLLWQDRSVVAALTARFTRDSVDTFGAPMPNTERLDASVAVNVTQSLRVTARIENLTDNQDPQVRDYNQI
ncbi:MAG: TonB-dependent receptor, partial [Halieaceae bacterium]|nr:TonB-dependent receptor [Halieaceae bacterium]